MLEPEELLRAWPSWQKSSADKVLSSPAWRMDVSFARQRDRLTIDHAENADEIYLKVSLDDIEHVLGVRDSERYHDLHLIWSRKDALDKNIVLALIEKECGALFVLIEHVFGRDLKINGLAKGPSKGLRTAFKTAAYSFSIDLTSEMRLSLGDISYLDPKHDSIRSMTRAARADYAAITLDESALKDIEVGDVIPLGNDYLSKAIWNLEGFAENEVHVVSAEESSLRFADFADDTLPEVKSSALMLLVDNDNVLAEGELYDLGGVPCFKLTRIHS